MDPENHERREARMLERKRQRWTENYTFFFGGLTEEEQQYRDYFQTDIEEDPEDEHVEEYNDEMAIAAEGQFQFKKYDFVETSLLEEPHESFDDVIEHKIFKYKYRQCNDDELTYARRQGRVLARFADRARNRDPVLEQDLFELYQQDAKDGSVAQFMLDPSKFANTAEDRTRPMREYMVNEALQQYRDYYETDGEEQSFFEYMDNMSNRDKIRFAEIYKDFTLDTTDHKDFVMIAKREYNPELSVFSNFVLDLIDFKDRVRPLAQDIALMDVTRQYQKINMRQLDEERAQFEDVIKKVQVDVEREALEEGYSSREIEEGSDSVKNE